MPLKKYSPTTPSRRFATVSTFEEITGSKPQRRLTQSLKKKAGRNSSGRITVRHRGGGHKRRYRVIDFRRDKHGISANVATIEYDPNRAANIALLNYADGEKRYILAPAGLKVGMTVESGPDAEPSVGNCLPLARIPLSSWIHNIELQPGRGGSLARSAGNYAQLMAREGNYANIKLPSGEVRKVHVRCMATLGSVSNSDSGKVYLGKAGRKRWMGIRPTVRGVSMNPVDHPMGGGEGRSSGGGHPQSPWGRLAKGGQSRAGRKPSNKFILKRRNK